MILEQELVLVSVEMAIAASMGKVYAVECQEEAQQLIEQNKEKFQLENLELVKGMAPDVMNNLPKPDVAFLGGNKGKYGTNIDDFTTKKSKYSFSN